MSKIDRVVIAIYIHPDYYPPTINAINCLADIANEVVVVTNNNSHDDFFIGNNVRYIKIGKFCTPIDYEKTSLPYKIFAFLKFTFAFFKQAINSKTSVVIMYDAIPLLSFFLFGKLISRKKTKWYHNHDMPMIKGTKKFSVGWFSAKYEATALNKVHIFSLPTSDRLKYYGNISSEIKYFELPNFPSQKIYNNGEDNVKAIEGNVVKLIYQGTIGPAHGIELIIPLLKETICNKSLELTLKGKVKEDYKKAVDNLAAEYGVAEKIKWIGIGPYKDVQLITKANHIGIGIHIGDAENSKPQGTASNKIYEYAACGLPALVYNNEQFKKHLSRYQWAVFVDDSVESMRNAIECCILNFNELSASAKNDFNQYFYFEKGFNQVLQHLTNNK